MMAETATPEDVQVSPPDTILTNAHGISVRKMIAADAEFVTHMQFEAFESKLIWATGEGNRQGINEFLTDGQRDDPKVHDRYLVALSESKPIGVCCMKFHGDADPGKDLSLCDYFNCRGLWGMMCMQCTLGRMSEIKTKETALVDILAVDSSQRGKGVGNVLLEAAEMEARKRECSRMILCVYHTNRAKNLYNRFGFETIVENSNCFYWCATGIKDYDLMEKKLE